MIRRSPTKIDLRIDDLAEYEALKKEREAKKTTDKEQGGIPAWGQKPTQTEIHERIGFQLQTPQTPQLPHPRSNLTL